MFFERPNDNRIKWIDIVKGICIVFVMLSHSNPPDDFRRFFTPFFLTMFFFASGCTFSTKNQFKEFILGKVYHLVCPLLLLGAIRVVGMNMMSGGNLVEGFKGLLLQISCQGDELWFVSCLFTTSILLYLLIQINKKLFRDNYLLALLLYESVIFLLIGYSIILLFHQRIIWEFEIACIMLLYMVLGYICKRNEYLPTHKGMISIVLFIIYCLILVLNKNDVDIHAEIFPNPFIFNISALLMIIPMIEFSKWIEKTMMAKLFIFLGQNSLFYFAFSGIIREILIRFVNFEMDPHITSILCTCLMIVILIIPAKVTRKYFPWLVGAKKSGD